LIAVGDHKKIGSRRVTTRIGSSRAKLSFAEAPSTTSLAREGNTGRSSPDAAFSESIRDVPFVAVPREITMAEAKRVGDLLPDRSYRLERIEGRDAHRFQRRTGGPEIVSFVGITYSVASAILPRPFLPIKS